MTLTALFLSLRLFLCVYFLLYVKETSKIKMNKTVLQLTMTNFIQKSIMIEFWLKNKNCNVIRYYDRLLGINVFFLFLTLMQYSLLSA